MSETKKEYVILFLCLKQTRLCLYVLMSKTKKKYVFMFLCLKQTRLCLYVEN